MYIELHARSAFSFLEGASVPEEFAEVCAAYQMPAMALLDRDGVYGAPRFHLAAKKHKVKAHIGAEITSLLVSCAISSLTRKGQSARSSALPSDAYLGLPIPRLSLLCASRAGYQNLCRLVTRMKLRAPKYPVAYRGGRQKKTRKKSSFSIASCGLALGSRVNMRQGLICLTGGTKVRWHGAGQWRQWQRASATLEQLIAIYRARERLRRIAAPLQSRAGSAQPGGDRIGAQTGIAAAGDAGRAICQREERQILDVFTCIRNQRTLDDGRPPAGAQQRALHQDAAGDAPAVRRSAGGDGEHGRAFRTPGVHAGRSGIRVSALSRARWRNA